MSRFLLASAWIFLCATSTPGQEIPPDVRLPYAVDTGWTSNDSDEPMVVAAFAVHVDGASSLRLYFDELALAGDPAAGLGSQVSISSLADGATQTLDARTVAQWRFSTAYFNGDTVLVELLAQPGTGRNRLRLSSVDAGAPPIIPKSQCGSTDDRVPSDDPRVGRLMPVGCTAWMIDDCQHCFLSAGHCVGSIDLVEFNVPFSTLSGGLVHPGTEDQYVVDDSSIQSNGGLGIGNDYAYFGCFPNSQTGMTPAQAQGSWFELVPPPPVAGNTIRITGYGTDTTPNATYNQIQQTATGPFLSVAGTALSYQVDTQGGNSGSPVIWNNTDQAIGIHTHGGCSTTTGNQGTSSTLVSLQNVLASPKGVCNVSCAWTDLGQGLAGAFGVPQLSGQGDPEAGNLIVLAASGLTLFGTTNLVAGLAVANLPFKGGTLVPTPDILLAGLPISLTTAAFQFTFPAGVPAGTIAVFQYWTPDPVGVAGWSATNAQQLTVP